MKAPVFAVLMILAGAFAVPAQLSDDRDVVTNFIRDLINNIAQFFKDSGLDPYELRTYSYEYSGNLLQFKFNVNDLVFTGASNIVISNLFNNILFSNFDFDVALPQLRLSLGNAGVEAVINTNNFNAAVAGSLAINNIRLKGQVSYEGNIITGVRIVNIDLDNSIGGFVSDVTATVNGQDYSGRVNTFLNDTLPNTLENFKTEINDWIARTILDYINRPRA